MKIGAKSYLPKSTLVEMKIFFQIFIPYRYKNDLSQRILTKLV